MGLSRALELTPEELDDLMSVNWIGRIATLGPGDRINLTAMYFGWAGGKVYMYARGQKVVNLRRNPSCTVHVDENERFPELRGAMLQGKATVLETPEEEAADPHLPDLRVTWAEKYGWKRPNPGTATGENMRWIVLVPEKIVSWDNAKIAALKERRRREKEQRQAQQ